MALDSQTTPDRAADGQADSLGVGAAAASNAAQAKASITSKQNSESIVEKARLIEAGPIVFFDGVCGLCNHFVDFVLKHDRNQRFRFAPLQGETAEQLLDVSDTESLKSIVLIDEAGTHRRSTAVVRVLRGLGFGWRILGTLFWLVPLPLRNVGYHCVAKMRYLMFGKKESCRMPTPEERGRLLP